MWSVECQRPGVKILPKESEVSAVFSLRDVWSLLRCSCKCVSSVCIYVRHIGPQIPHKFLSCSLLSPSVLFLGEKSISCPKRWTLQLFIYSVGVWWRRHAVSPNNRLSFWRRRHRGREQQPESIPLKHCLLPGRSQGRIRAQGHTLPCTHVYTHTLIKTFVFSICRFITVAQCLSFSLNNKDLEPLTVFNTIKSLNQVD